MASKTVKPEQAETTAAQELRERVKTPLVPGPGDYDAERDLILPKAPAETEEVVPMGVIPNSPQAKAEHKEFLVYTSFKNLGTLAAIAWIITQPTGAVEWSAFAFFYVTTMLGHNMAHHRYFGHGAFKTSTPMRYALAILAQFCGIGSALTWVANHRRHHALTDRPGDLHSPFFDGRGKPLQGRKGFAHAQLGWAFDDCSTDMAIYGKGLENDKVLVWAHKTRWVWFWMSGIVLPAAWGYGFGGTWQHALGTVLIAGCMRMVVTLHIISMLNSVCHLKGYRRYDSPGKDRNNVIVALLDMGEGWHNNHHAHPRSANNAAVWWEIDMTYWVIRGLEFLGLVWDVKRMPKGDGAGAPRLF